MQFLESEANLDKLIKLTVVILVTLAIAFAGVYLYYLYQLKESSPVNIGIKQLEQAVRRNPLDVNARFNLGRGYLALERYDEAITQLKEGLKIDAEHQGCLVYLGLVYLKKKNDEEARKYFKREIRLYENAGFPMENKWLEEAYYQMAYLSWKKKDNKEALRYITKALSIGRANSDNYFFLGRIHYDNKNYPAAITAFRQAALLDPKYADAHYGMAKALEKDGQLGEAVWEYNLTLKCAPRAEEVSKKRDELLKSLEEKAKKKQDSNNCFELGLAYIGLDKYQEATQQLLLATKFDSKNARAFYFLGMAYELQGRKKEARKSYQQAAKIDAKNVLAPAALKRMNMGMSIEEAIANGIRVK